MWTSLTTWFTPASLFILVNVVIATIAITSRFTADKSRHHPHGGPALIRPPSFLDRVKSFNFTPSNSDYYSNPDPSPARMPSMLGRLKSITINRSDSIREPETLQPAAEAKKQSPEKTHHDHSVSRSKSENITHAPATSLRRRLEKSLSEKLPSWVSFTTPRSEPGELINEIERRRPATVRADAPETTETGEEEVDLRADHFINKFKQQLKLQRLESLLRCRDMVTGKK
ncbi:pathogen-associated molecular patterns-induced protein A70-like [Benincasa hispida]|uniref:pathogen-associated molecular patterns-induced protein A70-like n=1 Tax=Benincasa hispida TaxID=102211 RepID=UPI001900814F|nr:pathogen-associated molecular patterns-induced protein A70-like [Benincasa hispida]